MEYYWRNPSTFYVMIKDDYIGKIEKAKIFTEEHRIGYNWILEIETPPIADFDLEEFLISSNFDLYEKREVKKMNDGKITNLYYKFSNCELVKTYKSVNASDNIENFSITIECPTRESVACLPEEIKE